MNNASTMARQEAKRFAEALSYLDNCGTLTKDKFIKVNQIAGDELSRSQLEQMWDAMEIAIIANGDGEIRQSLRSTFEKGAAVFGYTASGLDELSVEKKPWWKFW